MSKGGNDTQSTTQTVSFPDWMTDGQKAAFGLTTSMAAPFIQVPKAMVAGFTPDQTKGFDLTRQMAQGTFTGSPVRSIASTPQTAGLSRGTASKVTPAAIQDHLNPFVEGVVAPTLTAMRREQSATQTGIGARAAAAGSFGGSREAIERSLASRAHNEGVQKTVAELMAGGYEAARAGATNDAQMAQQMELANVGAANNVSQFNATTANDFGLRAAGVEDGLASNDQQRQLAAIQALLGIGGTQQGLAQASLDTPWTALAKILAVTPSVSPSTTTNVAPNTNPSTFQQLLGAGLTVGGMGTAGGGTLLGNALMGLSDRDEKTNIQKLGVDPDTGLDLYAYDYKADVDAAKRDGRPMGPKRVGPMAQDVARAGGRTTRIGGKLVMVG